MLFLKYLFVLVPFTLLFTFLGISGYSLVCYNLFFLILFHFIHLIGRKIPIKELIILFAVLQWLVGAAIYYDFFNDVNNLYKMSIPKETYMSFVLPGTLLFILGMYIPYKHRYANAPFSIYSLENELIDKAKRGKTLVIVGISASFIKASGVLPVFLNFVFVLIEWIQYVGLFYIIFSPVKNKKLWIIMVMGLLFIKTITGGMFFYIVLFTLFLIIILSLKNKPSLNRKLAITLVLCVFTFLMQSIKRDLREKTWGVDQSVTHSISVFQYLISDRLSDLESIFQKENLRYNAVRINQGWIIARIIYYVPEYEPYAKGETVRKAVFATLLPRFLAPNKAEGGGIKNFERFTGIDLYRTSMDLSIIGEAYANFGPTGGLLFMFVFGIILNVLYTHCYIIALRKPEFLLWLPLLFLQVIVAERDIMTSMNHFVKASILTGLFFIAFKRKII